ncbi:MAG: hypothetical protein HQM15_01530 [Deltaproteobacteria bacterium]|nr:hypothetical protein [Deltaproteobacteria bacterium]
MKEIIKLVLFFILTLVIGSCSAESKPKIIRGVVNITPAYANKGGPSDTLYIFVFKALKKEGPESAPESHPAYLRETPPLVIKKISPVLFPVKFEISEQDVLFPENQFKDQINVVARLSRSGSPLAKKGDLEGVYKKNPAKVGDQNLEILINQEASLN